MLRLTTRVMPLPLWLGGKLKTCYSANMTEVQIYRRALERIAKLNTRTCEQYVAKADAIAVEALVMGDSVQPEADQSRLRKAA